MKSERARAIGIALPLAQPSTLEQVRELLVAAIAADQRLAHLESWLAGRLAGLPATKHASPALIVARTNANSGYIAAACSQIQLFKLACSCSGRRRRRLTYFFGYFGC